MANRLFTSQFQYSFEKQMVNLVGAFTQTAILTKATLVNQGVTYTAVNFGAAGNNISLTLVNPGDATSALAITTVGSAISVSLQSTASVKATLVNQGLTYTAVATGTGGNAITVALVDPLANDQSLSVSVTGNAITVNLATGVAGAITSTADTIKAAIIASSPAHALVNVAGSGASPVIALTATHLAGGLAAAIVTTAGALITAINADGDASALVVATGSGSSPLVALTLTHMAGGIDSAFSNNLPVQVMSLLQTDTGIYTLTLTDAYKALLSAQIQLQASSAVDLMPQIVSSDVSSASKTIVFKMLSGSTPTNMVNTDILFIDLKLRNVV